MRFSPHRTISNSSLEEIDPGYDSLSDDEYTEDDIDHLTSSSPFKELSLMTPSKSKPDSISLRQKGSPRNYTKYRAFRSSPLAKNDFVVSAETTQESYDDTVDELNELLSDVKLKETYDLIAEISRNSNSAKSRRKNFSRGSVNRNRRASLIEVSSDSENRYKIGIKSSPLQKIAASSLKDDEIDVISSLESRLQRRSKEIEEKIKFIEQEERKKKEEEAKRCHEEEERIRKEAEERKLKEAERKAKLEAERLQQEREDAENKKKEQERLELEKLEKAKQAEELENAKKQEEARQKTGLSDWRKVEQEFLHFKKMISDIKVDIVEKVKQTPDIKKACSQHKRKINPKFGQLTNSLTQLNKITRELIQLINLARANELAYKWILNFVAKAIVAQAETEVRVAPSSSLPLGKLTLNLLVEFPELKEFLMARFVKKCPYIIGYTCEIDTVEGRLRMGWKRNEDDRWEEDVSYDERLAGMMTLYAVITRLVLDQPYFQTHEHPLPISHSWLLVSRLLNRPAELLTNTHYVVISAWWEAAARELLMSFGTQANKLLQLIVSDWITLGNKFTGAKRLETIGEDWLSSGTIATFAPMEP